MSLLLLGITAADVAAAVPILCSWCIHDAPNTGQQTDNSTARRLTLEHWNTEHKQAIPPVFSFELVKSVPVSQHQRAAPAPRAPSKLFAAASWVLARLGLSCPSAIASIQPYKPTTLTTHPYPPCIQLPACSGYTFGGISGGDYPLVETWPTGVYEIWRDGTG